MSVVPVVPVVPVPVPVPSARPTELRPVDRHGDRAAEATVPGDRPWTSDAVLLAIVTGNPSYTYTWAQAEAAGAR